MKNIVFLLLVVLFSACGAQQNAEPEAYAFRLTSKINELEQQLVKSSAGALYVINMLLGQEAVKSLHPATCVLLTLAHAYDPAFKTSGISLELLREVGVGDLMLYVKDNQNRRGTIYLTAKSLYDLRQNFFKRIESPQFKVELEALRTAINADAGQEIIDELDMLSAATWELWTYVRRAMVVACSAEEMLVIKAGYGEEA